MQNEIKTFIHNLPKAELHVHIEGTLEPEMLFELAERNSVKIPFDSIEDAHKAYNFTNLQDFLNIYYQCSKVLVGEEDFYDLATAYLKKAVSQNVRHTEIFFDPQAHTARGVSFETVLNGITNALENANHELGISSKLILCFLRDLSTQSAMDTLEQALPHKDRIIAVGLDSSETGNPPSKFREVFDLARKEGLLSVAHAGEEGPAAYIWEALDILKASRIDHGIKCQEDKKLMKRLVDSRVPLTVCPLSNVKLRVFDKMSDHNFKYLLEQGLSVTINSDDPAYLGGYIEENYLALEESLHLTRSQLALAAKNSFNASFLSDSEKERYISEIDKMYNES